MARSEEPGAKTTAETISAILAAVTAAAALVVVPGALVMFLRLDDADLPADLGIVVSLPSQFLLAIGLAFVLFPLLIVGGLATALTLGPGEPDPAHTGSEQRPSRSTWLSGLLVLFVLALIPGLPLAVNSSLAWKTVGLSVLTAAVWVWLSRAVARGHAAGKTGTRTAAGLAALVATVAFLPWTVAFAVARGELPPATVCRPDGKRLDGFLVGEADNRVYVGEIPNRVVLFLNLPGNGTLRHDIRSTLRGSSYDVRAEASPNAVTFGRVGLVIVDVAELDPTEAERLFEIDQTAHLAFLAFTSDGTRPPGVPADLPLFERKTLGNSAQLLDRTEVALRESTNEARPRLRITSVPSAQVSRLLIGNLGPCPAVES